MPSSEYAVNIVTQFANVNKVNIFYGIVLIPLAYMLFLSMYTFIILTMRLCARRNSYQTVYPHVTFLNLYLYYNSP